MSDVLVLEGPSTLCGEIPIAGAKNAVLPCMAAALLTAEPLVLENVPPVQDVFTLRELLTRLGVDVQVDGDQWTLRAERVVSTVVPSDLTRRMRASFLTLGPLGVRFGSAEVAYPGGCAIGERPVDLHLAGLEALGFEVDPTGGRVRIRARRLRGAVFEFAKVTVTGTEHLMMTAAAIPATTVLRNCAREPEVVQLAELLRSMGADIEGAGTAQVVVRGTSVLRGAAVRVIPDRIEAGTYAIATVLTRGRVVLRGAQADHWTALVGVLAEQGAVVEAGSDGVLVDARGIDAFRPLRVRTEPYPGFPTDLQAQLMVLMTQAAGVSEVVETVFPDRFHHVADLRRMGAHIELVKPVARVYGPTPLRGALVTASDLRASACLVLAGLVARGVTVVTQVHHLDRGYVRMEEKLRQAGAAIRREVMA
jgi:UDP-N-acetylglucosamine 1-carboxyvinyltransferase